MSDETSTTEPEVPEWVQEMRAMGYTVRVGTDPRPLPYKPEISYHDFEPPATKVRRRTHDFVRDLWCYAVALKRRIVHR